MAQETGLGLGGPGDRWGRAQLAATSEAFPQADEADAHGLDTFSCVSRPFAVRPSRSGRQTQTLPMLSMFDGLEQLGDLQRQGRGHPLDVDEADVARAPLDVREVGPVEARPATAKA